MNVSYLKTNSRRGNSFQAILRFCVVLVVPLAWGVSLQAQSVSVFSIRPDDPRAVNLAAPAFPVHGDGVGDDTQALQSAINFIQQTTRQGILFIPEGRYRVTSTLYVWKGIRLIGYGTHRPVFVLPPHTNGFQDVQHRYLIQFSAERSSDATAPPSNGNAGTFYSAMSNIDIVLGEGNPSAVAIRFHVAQHCFLSHLRIEAGTSYAAIEDAGNLMTDLEIIGGDYAISTRKTAPTWPFILMDSSLRDQHRAALRTADGNPVLLRLTIEHVPVAIEIEPAHIDQILLRDSTLRDVQTSAISLGDAKNLHGSIALHSIFCSSVARVLSFPDREPIVAPAKNYVVDALNFGLEIAPNGLEQGITLLQKMHEVEFLPSSVVSDIPQLPPVEDWVSVRSFGVLGNGVQDDSEAFQRAVQSHKPLYLPQGRYRVTQPIQLAKDTILIGLNPITTQIELADKSPAFAQAGEGRALLSAPEGGKTIVSGIGLSTGGTNPHAIALLWQAGANSLVDDVRFLGGHGTTLPNGQSRPAYNAARTGDPDPSRVWNSELPSLVVRNGGGIFRNIWSASTYSQAAFAVENTQVPGKVYGLSAEHHLRYEVILNGVHHWNFYALQTEEELAEGAKTVPLTIRNSSDLMFAGTAIYRVSRTVTPAETAIQIESSKNLSFTNLRNYSGSRFAFDRTIVFTDIPVSIRSRIWGIWQMGMHAPEPASLRAKSLQKHFSGLKNISQLTSHGNTIYFLDPPSSHIYSWSTNSHLATLEIPHFEKTGFAPQFLYALPNSTFLVEAPNSPQTQAYILDLHSLSAPVKLPQSAAVPHEGSFLIPTAIRSEMRTLGTLTPPQLHSVFPVSEKLVLPHSMDPMVLLTSSGAALLTPGKPFLVTSEADGITSKLLLTGYGPEAHNRFTPLIARGGEALAVDATGTIYIADGDVRLYSAEGQGLGILRTPERPVALLVKDRRLYIASRSSLYSISLPIPSAELDEP